MARKLASNLINVPLVTSLPTVTEATEVYYQSAAMATSGARWHLVYNSASASIYKWEFVGGGNLHAEHLAISTGLTTTISAAFNVIVVPLVGDYDVSMVANLAAASQGQGTQGWLYINGVQVADHVIQMGSDATGGGLGILSSVGFTFRITNTVAGATFDNRYIVASAGTGTVGNRSMTITPVRVG